MPSSSHIQPSQAKIHNFRRCLQTVCYRRCLQARCFDCFMFLFFSIFMCPHENDLDFTELKLRYCASNSIWYKVKSVIFSKPMSVGLIDIHLNPLRINRDNYIKLKAKMLRNEYNFTYYYLNFFNRMI